MASEKPVGFTGRTTEIRKQEREGQFRLVYLHLLLDGSSMSLAQRVVPIAMGSRLCLSPLHERHSELSLQTCTDHHDAPQGSDIQGCRPLLELLSQRGHSLSTEVETASQLRGPFFPLLGFDYSNLGAALVLPLHHLSVPLCFFNPSTLFNRLPPSHSLELHSEILVFLTGWRRM